MRASLSVLLAGLVALPFPAYAQCAAPNPPLMTAIDPAYESLVALLLASPNDTVKLVRCPNGTDECLVVSMMDCDEPRDACGAVSDAQTERRCQATDELSQVGVVLSMALDAESARAFRAWFNMIQAVRSAAGNADTLPGWMARVTWPKNQELPIATVTVTHTDDATDANLRMALALYIAGNSTSSWLTSAEKASYRKAADDLALAIRTHDYIHKSYDVRGGIDHWLASGRKAASTNGGVYCFQTPDKKAECGGISFAGYHGDAIITMLAAYANTCDATYLTFARDSFRSYLHAANYDGTFRVPPTQYGFWGPAQNDPSTYEVQCHSDCRQSCDPTGYQWDSRDAVRAVTACKSAYFYARLGQEIPAELQTYCALWRNTGALADAGGNRAYVKSHAANGSFCEGESTRTSYFNNGLGASLNFYCNTSELASRVEAAIDQFALDANRLDPTCTSVYEPATVLIAYGSALGRDLGAFTPKAATPAGLLATASAHRVDVTWSVSCGATSYEVWRKGSNEHEAHIATTSATSYADLFVDATKAYVYRVRAIRNGVASGFSNRDLAVPATFSSALTTIRASHLEELRTAVQAAEAATDSPSASFTDPVLAGTKVRAAHIAELRQRLAAVRASLSLNAAVYSYPASAGTPVRAADVQELRNALR